MARGSNPFRAQAEARVGKTFARKWHIDRLIDIGGMASVYAATHRNGNRVAIKVLHKIYAEHPEARERFLREGYVANQVDHPGAVTVQDDDVLEDGTAFLVMELLDGSSLEGRLAGGRVLPAPGVLYVADQILDVLAAAHAKHIVHRDIKPANIFLTSSGEAKLLDFGLARVRQRTMKLSTTRTGMVIGTASYMPPEQARGRHDAVDARTDLWAVAATMFRALTGRFVHEGAASNERLIKAMAERAPKLRDVVPDAPEPVADVVDRGLEFQKSDRWPDAMAMQTAVREAYQALEHAPMPSVRRAPDVEASSGAVPELSDPLSDLHVSVVFDTSDTTGQSIIVEFSKPEGASERVALRRKSETPPSSDDEISEVSVVEYDEHDTTL